MPFTVVEGKIVSIESNEDFRAQLDLNNDLQISKVIKISMEELASIINAALVPYSKTEEVTSLLNKLAEQLSVFERIVSEKFKSIDSDQATLKETIEVSIIGFKESILTEMTNFVTRQDIASLVTKEQLDSHSQVVMNITDSITSALYSLKEMISANVRATKQLQIDIAKKASLAELEVVARSIPEPIKVEAGTFLQADKYDLKVNKSGNSYIISATYPPEPAQKAAGGGSKGIKEAPQDGLIYGRKNKTWVEVSGVGGDIDGGAASSIYLATQLIDGGNA